MKLTTEQIKQINTIAQYSYRMLYITFRDILIKSGKPNKHYLKWMIHCSKLIKLTQGEINNRTT